LAIAIWATKLIAFSAFLAFSAFDKTPFDSFSPFFSSFPKTFPSVSCDLGTSQTTKFWFQDLLQVQLQECGEEADLLEPLWCDVCSLAFLATSHDSD
jgi:hypothetical protein